VVNDQLAVLAEQVGQLQFAVWAVKLVVLVDFDLGQRAALGAEAVAFFGEGLFVGQMLFARSEPFFSRYDRMILDVHDDFSCGVETVFVRLVV